MTLREILQPAYKDWNSMNAIDQAALWQSVCEHKDAARLKVFIGRRIAKNRSKKSATVNAKCAGYEFTLVAMTDYKLFYHDPEFCMAVLIDIMTRGLPHDEWVD